MLVMKDSTIKLPADRIAELEAENERYRHALEQIHKAAVFCVDNLQSGVPLGAAGTELDAERIAEYTDSVLHPEDFRTPDSRSRGVEGGVPERTRRSTAVPEAVAGRASSGGDPLSAERCWCGRERDPGCWKCEGREDHPKHGDRKGGSGVTPERCTKFDPNRCGLDEGHSGNCLPVPGWVVALEDRSVVTHRLSALQEPTKRLLDELVGELEGALGRFPSFNSPHEGKAVIEEELDELWEHVKANTGRSPEARKEAVQVAAMALRYVLDLSGGQA
jgi:hypothetical protein